jgi:ABC-type bacteriocin/lantibiotic exporter with double-glycine peptidase domain
MNALTGENGSGKSTLLKLLSGFFTPSKGEIIFPFKNELKLMYIAQDAPLFNRSIYKNICYPSLKPSIETVLNLVKEIGLDTLIQTKDDLNNKTPGDFKNKISGGEVQKILFLRAIIAKPDVLLLDEFTSSLDEKAINKVYLMINKYLDNTTIISVIHRVDELSYYSNIVNIAPTH